MKSKKPLISAVINVRNEGPALKKCLTSIKDLVSEIIVVDMHSTDNSVKIAQQFNAKVFSYRPLKVVEPARNFGLSKAKGKWILLLDPDEYLGRSLKKELLSITQRPQIDFVKIPRKNIIFGKWIQHANMWPDYLIRFFKKGKVRWQKQIHSQPLASGNGLTLLDSPRLAINHQNYQSVTDFVNRALRYADVKASELKRQQYKLKISDLILKPVEEFNSRFFAAAGFKDGLYGLVFCLLQAFSVALVYIRLWEKGRPKSKLLAAKSFVSASQQAVFEYDFWFTRFFTHQYSSNIFKKFIIKTHLFFHRLIKNL